MTTPLFAVGISCSGDPEIEFVDHNGYSTIIGFDLVELFTREEAEKTIKDDVVHGALWTAREALTCVALQRMGAQWANHSAHQKIAAVHQADTFLAQKAA